MLGYDIVAKTGDPVEELLREAHGGNYDLIVIGEHSDQITNLVDH